MHEQLFLNPIVQPHAMVLVIDSGHAGAVDVTGTSSSAIRAHPYSSLVFYYYFLSFYYYYIIITLLLLYYYYYYYYIIFFIILYYIIIFYYHFILLLIFEVCCGGHSCQLQLPTLHVWGGERKQHSQWVGAISVDLICCLGICELSSPKTWFREVVSIPIENLNN